MRSCAGLVVAVCSTLVGLILFGFVPTTDTSQYIGAGYGTYSMNLLSPLDPEKYRSLLLRQQPTNPGQNEGYNYLGLGLLLLVAISFARAPANLRFLLTRAAVPTGFVLAVSLLLALSTKATAGNAQLYNVTLPDPLMHALAALRCSGRLFWPGYYLLIAASIALSRRAFHGRGLYLVLAAALVVQFLDTMTLSATIREYWSAATARSAPQGADWAGLGQSQGHLAVVPAWQCSLGADTPGGSAGFDIFGKLALQQNMTINSVYAGRYSKDQMKFFCRDQLEDILTAGLQDDTAYVFHQRAATMVNLQYGKRYCRESSGYILCSAVPGRSGIDPLVTASIPVVDATSVVSFDAENPTAAAMLGLGWSAPEQWGRQTVGQLAALAFRLASRPTDGLHVVLTVDVFAPPTHPRQHVDIRANGTPVLQRTLGAVSGGELSVRIPPGVIGDDGLVRVDFRLPDAVSPAALGLSVDQRELSIGVRQLRIVRDGGSN